MNGSGRIATWQDAELLAAAWMREHGFPDARVTGSGADGGVDVFSNRALAQVKYQTNSVGRPPLQRLFGSRGLAHDKQLLFFTRSSYTATAREYADMTSIALYVYTLDGTVHPANNPAERLAASARRTRRLRRSLRKTFGDGSSAGDERPKTAASTAIAVTVSGGVTGIRRSGEVAFEGDPRREEVERLLSQIDFSVLPAAPAFPVQMDGLVYAFSVHGANYVVADWQLTEDLGRLALLVLDS